VCIIHDDKTYVHGNRLKMLLYCDGIRKRTREYNEIHCAGGTRTRENVLILKKKSERAPEE